MKCKRLNVVSCIGFTLSPAVVRCMERTNKTLFFLQAFVVSFFSPALQNKGALHAALKKESVDEIMQPEP